MAIMEAFLQKKAIYLNTGYYIVQLPVEHTLPNIERRIEVCVKNVNWTTVPKPPFKFHTLLTNLKTTNT